MSNCGCSKDQTPKEVWDFIEKENLPIHDSKKAVLGIATFLVPDPEAGILETKVVWVGDITREETEKRAANCFGYQWAPKGMPMLVNGKEIKVNAIEDLHPYDCTSKKCSASGCSMGCYCNTGDTGNCKKNPIRY